MARKRPKFRLRIDQEAQEDIDEAFDWRMDSKNGETYRKAVQYTRWLNAAVRKVGSNPRLTESKDLDPEHFPGVRMYHAKHALAGSAARHFVFYVVIPPDVVNVLRVLGDTRDFPSLLQHTFSRVRAREARLDQPEERTATASARPSARKRRTLQPE